MHCLQRAVFYSMSRVNNICLFVINYLSQRCQELSKARCCNFAPAFWKLPKGGTEIFQACDSCCMSQFCASIVLAFRLIILNLSFMVISYVDMRMQDVVIMWLFLNKNIKFFVNLNNITYLFFCLLILVQIKKHALLPQANTKKPWCYGWFTCWLYHKPNVSVSVLLCIIRYKSPLWVSAHLFWGRKNLQPTEGLECFKLYFDFKVCT